MPLRIALMRSVQIAGRRVKMADVRRLAESIGGTDVHTVVATGNLVFRSRKAPATLERELEAACEARYGGDFYVWFGSGDVFASKIPAGFGLRALGATGTNRNWNTMTRIARLVNEMAAAP